jgi:hypothetical protein
MTKKEEKSKHEVKEKVQVGDNHLRRIKRVSTSTGRSRVKGKLSEDVSFQTLIRRTYGASSALGFNITW